MRRPASIAVFVLVLSVSLWAQRGGGGHAGFGGGHAGFGGGHASGFGGHVGGGSFGGGHFSGAPRGASGFHGGNGFAHSNHFGSRGPFLHDGFRHTRFRTFGFRNNCFGWRCGWGWSPWWWGSAYYDPWWQWNQDDQQFDNDYYRQYQIANEMNQQSLEQQRMWRQEEADGDQDAYAPRRPNADPAPNAQAQNDPDPVAPPTVLVFRNGHREETQNYAIVGEMLWSFNSQRTERVLLASLDLPATEKANLERGVDFHIPESNSEPAE
jgi:hypothetical protein